MQERQGCAMTERQAHGCAVRMLWFLVIVAVWIATAYGVYKLGSMAIEALIPDAEAVDAYTTSHTNFEENSCGTSGTSCCTSAEVESDCEFPPELLHPTIGEVDAEAEENYWIEEALLARSHKIENCKITYYCCEKYPHICGTGDGLTALGTEVTPFYSCAVPPGIPLGSTIMIDWGDGSEIEYRLADDRGGGVIGDHIDLAVPTHAEALELGVRYATVYWVEEETK